MDYRDQRQRRTLHAYMVSPHNLDDTYGEMTGIDWSSLTLSAGYYTDTRVSGALCAVNSNYIKNSFIRIVVEHEDGTAIELGTFAVANDDGQRTNGAYSQQFELISMLHTLSLDYFPDNLVLGKGAMALSVFEKTLTDVGKTKASYIISGARDYRFSNTLVMEAGTSRLSRLFELSNLADNRLDVDGHGRITLKPYTPPDIRTPSFTLDTADPRGVIMGDISRSSTWKDTPTRAVVAYDYTEGEGDKAKQKHMYAIAWNNKTDPRGYWITDYQTISDLNPATKAHLTAKAKENLSAQLGEKTEWTLPSKYIPNLWEGDIVELIVRDELDDYVGARKCLVKSIDITGEFLDMELTLKETSGGDNE